MCLVMVVCGCCVVVVCVAIVCVIVCWYYRRMSLPSSYLNLHVSVSLLLSLYCNVLCCVWCVCFGLVRVVVVRTVMYQLVCSVVC